MLEENRDRPATHGVVLILAKEIQSGFRSTDAKVILLTERQGQLELSQQRMERTLDTVAAQVAALSIKVVGHDAQFASIDARFEAIDARFVAIENRLTSLESRMDRLEERMDRIEQRMDRLEQKFDLLLAHFGIKFPS